MVSSPVRAAVGAVRPIGVPGRGARSARDDLARARVDVRRVLAPQRPAEDGRPVGEVVADGFGLQVQGVAHCAVIAGPLGGVEPPGGDQRLTLAHRAQHVLGELTPHDTVMNSVFRSAKSWLVVL